MSSDEPPSPDRPTLAQLVSQADLWLNKGLLAALEASDYTGFSRADILMLANLDCGTTYPSELARRIGVSRQAVYKLLKNLEQKGIVALEPDSERRNAKVIVITPAGERMIHTAVEILRGIESHLEERVGPERLRKLREILQMDWGDPPRS